MQSDLHIAHLQLQSEHAPGTLHSPINHHTHATPETPTIAPADTMADEASTNALPPPPSTAGAPGLNDPNMPPTNGSANPSHMPPPPLQPVVIPQNNNPIPTAVTSPFSGGAMTPSSAGGAVRRAAPEPNKRALYVGGLDPKVGEDLLRQIFETAGHVQSVKIIPDKHVGRPSLRVIVLSSVQLPPQSAYVSLGRSFERWRVNHSPASPPRTGILEDNLPGD